MLIWKMRDPKDYGFLSTHCLVCSEGAADADKDHENGYGYVVFDGNQLEIGYNAGEADMDIDNISVDLYRGEDMKISEVQSFLNRYKLPPIPARLFGYVLTGVDPKFFTRL